ncbi:hypothetical protein, partial [Escherichia coli]|uniref:hypothetical protein n=1 Tax=Escherichia coli TaxID=562 RepID=UPI002073CF90
ADRNRSHWSTSKTPSYTKSVSWQHHPEIQVHNQYKQLSTMFNFISDMFFNSDPYQTETLLVFSF